MRMKVMTPVLVGVLGVALAGCGNSDDIIMAEGSDRYPNQTATDWVTYADHVVLVTATSDRALPPDEEDSENNEGYIPRKAVLSVDEVIWSREDASHPAPKGEFEWDAWGWAWQDGERIPMASEDEPRIEVGHTYIMAIAWEPTLDDGYDYLPAHWVGLGSDAVIPYDDGVIGKGELAGEEQGGASPLAASDPNFSLEDELAGRSTDELGTALHSATPGVRLDY
jgi:hypothetical protein